MPWPGKTNATIAAVNSRNRTVKQALTANMNASIEADGGPRSSLRLALFITRRAGQFNLVKHSSTVPTSCGN